MSATSITAARLSSNMTASKSPRGPLHVPVRILLWTLLLRVVYSALAAFFLGMPAPGDAARRATNLTLPVFHSGWKLWLLEPWQRFDTAWYVQIAASGYQDPNSTVFYPLYPLLLRGLPVEPMLAALTISTVAAFFFFWAFHKLAEQEYGTRAAWTGLLLLWLWPSSCILFAGYPESLLLALLAWSLWFGTQKRWLAAGTLGCLAGFSKATGCLVAIPLLLLAWRSGRNWKSGFAALPFATYPAWQLWVANAGFPGTQHVYEQYWRTAVTSPWNTFFAGLREWLATHDWLLAANLGAVVLVIAGSFLLRPYLALFCLAAVAFFLLKHTDPLLQSSVRYCMVAFPVFFAAARRPGLWLVPAGGLLGVANLAALYFFVHWSLVL